ncbi:hypothetical protein B7494_g2969 [Chlorociboria aeruginascens]|nr:hypothetical protein B7494_g2969 [Chlorociboria aeruginascens]
MLSNPNSNLQNRQRQHRRQNSTPVAFEAVKVTSLPNIQSHGAHRRGMSLDQRQRQTPPQETTVSITNQGYQTTPQHILRETQQQRLARPGQNFGSYDNDENYLNSPIGTPHRQSFDTGCNGLHGATENSSPYTYSGPIDTTSSIDPNSFNGASDFNLFSTDGPITPSVYLDFSSSLDANGNEGSINEDHRRGSSGRRISGGIIDRVAQFEQLALKSPQRPLTPPNKNAKGNYFPLTPADTPLNRKVKHEQYQQRFPESYDTSMEETIKPKSNHRARGVFDDMRRAAEMNNLPSPPGTGSIPSISTFDSAPMPNASHLKIGDINLDFMKNQQLAEPQYSPKSSNHSPALSYHSMPESPQKALFGDPFVDKPSLEAPGMSSFPLPKSNDGLPNVISPAQSPYRRSESVSSINIDETITDTGITIDDIAHFIQGPDPIDQKWVCLYPECKKRFGRKENIKSHVQTHLGDRQFQCPHCHKCFVRQHDLKRHAKIHSGVKPYPCQCGNSFARHDALTRHRQRGMCIGAFEGIVRKTVKRGRPRKSRPDDEERLNKSSRTRQKNKAMSLTSSASESSEDISGHSPRSDLDILDNKPFGDYDYSQNSTAMDHSSFQYTQLQSPLPTNCVSPQVIQASSPSAFSHHSAYSEHRGSVSMSEQLPSYPSSPAKSVHSQYHSPPGLCDSSSPTASIHYYDDGTSNHGGELTSLSGLANISEHDDEMFLEAFAAASSDMTQLERDPDLLMGKFDDAFGAEGGDNLFKNSDVFFGSP